jgi:hypothetical protein
LDANGTTVTPDTRKGRIVVRTAEADGCLHFTWSDRSSNATEAEDDLILFPGDATFSRVESARNNAKNNRSFILFSSFASVIYELNSSRQSFCAQVYCNEKDALLLDAGIAC